MIANPKQDPQQDRQPMHMTVEEYLGYDRASDEKHEYYDGEVVALAGGTTYHNRLTLSMAALLMEELGKRGPCKVYASDMRVQVTKKHYVYPDVVVSCDISDHQGDSDILCSPHLIVEVLSPSTEKKDRGKKLDLYRAHPCVHEYVLINTRFQLVEVYRRMENGSWTHHTYGEGSVIELASLDLYVAVDALYEGLRIPPVPDDDELALPDGPEKERREEVPGDF
jgi:Uma2 family endonuclease